MGSETNGLRQYVGAGFPAPPAPTLNSQPQQLLMLPPTPTPRHAWLLREAQRWPRLLNPERPAPGALLATGIGLQSSAPYAL